MKQEILKLQDHITSKVMGLIWITEKFLVERPAPFAEIDYFLDGLLTTHDNSKLELKSKDEVKNIFFGTHFGFPFFVGHIISSEKNELLIAEIMEIAKKFKTPERQTIIVLDSSGKNLHRIEKKYPDFRFELLD